MRVSRRERAHDFILANTYVPRPRTYTQYYIKHTPALRARLAAAELRKSYTYARARAHHKRALAIADVHAGRDMNALIGAVC